MTQPAPPVEQPTSERVLARFVVRLVMLATFASFSTHGFGTSLAPMLLLASVFCVVTAKLRQEVVLGPVLTHWDEAAAFALANGVLTRLP